MFGSMIMKEDVMKLFESVLEFYSRLVVIISSQTSLEFHKVEVVYV